MKKGKFIILSGPSGVGKDTVASRLIDSNYGVYSVSMTTRDKRDNEVHGYDYFFTTEDVFMDNIKKNNFLEYAKYNGNYYGTLRGFVFDNINRGINVIGVLDVKGALNVKDIYKDAILIFIIAPSIEELEKRLKKRGTDSIDSIKNRLEIAKSEISYSDKYDYIVVNDDLDVCVKEIIGIINNIS